MTQIFDESGKVTPVTVVNAGPCFVTDKKNEEKHGYTAVQICFEETKKSNKPMKGFIKKVLNKENGYKHLKEFRMNSVDSMLSQLELGQNIIASIFNSGDKVNVQSLAKGKGFQGVVKRHGFKGSLATHGHKDQHRMPGSIGATGPAHVFKGTRMGGRMGGKYITTTNLEIIKVEGNLLYIKGAVPGARNGFVYVSGPGEFELPKQVSKPAPSTDLSSEASAKAEASAQVEEKEVEPKTPETKPEVKPDLSDDLSSEASAKAEAPKAQSETPAASPKEEAPKATEEKPEETKK